jgi:hypothetical protein
LGLDVHEVVLSHLNGREVGDPSVGSVGLSVEVVDIVLGPGLPLDLLGVGILNLQEGAGVRDSSVGLVGLSIEVVDMVLSPGLVLGLLGVRVSLTGLNQSAEVRDSGVGLVGLSIELINLALRPGLPLGLLSVGVSLTSLKQSAGVWDSGVGRVGLSIEVVNVVLSPGLPLLLLGVRILKLDSCGSVRSPDCLWVGLGGPVEVVGVWLLLAHPVVPLLLASDCWDIVVLHVVELLERIMLDLESLIELLHSANTFSPFGAFS